MLTTIPKTFLPSINQLDATPDGAVEVTLEVNDRIIATDVIVPGVDGVIGYNAYDRYRTEEKPVWSIVLERLMARLRSSC